MGQRFRWGHININVADLDLSISFYEELGFEIFMSGIPYLGLEREEFKEMPTSMAEALDVPFGTKGRSCIMQLDKGLPKLDLTEFSAPKPHLPYGIKILASCGFAWHPRIYKRTMSSLQPRA